MRVRQAAPVPWLGLVPPGGSCLSAALPAPATNLSSRPSLAPPPAFHSPAPPSTHVLPCALPLPAACKPCTPPRPPIYSPNISPNISPAGAESPRTPTLHSAQPEAPQYPTLHACTDARIAMLSALLPACNCHACTACLHLHLPAPSHACSCSCLPAPGRTSMSLPLTRSGGDIQRDGPGRHHV